MAEGLLDLAETHAQMLEKRLDDEREKHASALQELNEKHASEVKDLNEKRAKETQKRLDNSERYS